MVRPKKGTPNGDAAAKKQREAIIEKFGGVKGMREHFRRIGRIGGTVSCAKGFAVNNLASECGRKGGRISRRGPTKIQFIGKCDGEYVFKDIRDNEVIRVRAKNKWSAYNIVLKRVRTKSPEPSEN